MFLKKKKLNPKYKKTAWIDEQEYQKELNDFLTPYGVEEKAKQDKEYEREQARKARKEPRHERGGIFKAKSMSTFNRLKELYKEHVLKPTP
jgi:hypothetical protein